MKNLKKVLALLFVAVLLVSTVAGCGKKEDSDNGGSGSSSDESVFKIGGIGPLTGEAAVYGVAVKNGAELAVKEINEAGGIDGVPIEFKMEDDVHDAEKSVNAYNTLKDWGMQMVMGTVTSDPCIAVQSEAANDNIFLLTPSGTAVDAIKGPNAFRVCFSDPDQGTKSAEFIADHDLGKKIAVIYDSSITYSKGIYDNFVKEAKNQGLEIVSAEAYTTDSNKDFKVQLQKAKDSNADLLFLPIYYQEASLILKQADAMGYAPKVFGCDGLDGILNFDAEGTEGVMLLTPFVANADDELTKHFVESYKSSYKETPIQFAADAYDAIYAIKAAAEDAKITPDMSASDISDKMQASMLNIEVEGLTGTIQWKEDGEPNKEPKAVIIEDGEYQSLD
ncbi:branched-chain amino acid transport system substrate-binding protein [Aequitasia blattaphilus]|uniref:ABC transporter substrate-binding protein n=1 Tax=Aequitasia blattaphilus TaxID=2949332 RepID=A0ABT1E9B4_9FIRM|nr:ABC transporter substrate-binding protein [Aequitasia blattaphilus]MCP1101582.1 ABC transporter substrate-binding protein [Aequitasia blattaphilus]MCR8614222.1 ABC transporter substrate-binding protein [Aequitasia blattaphilus]